MRIEMLKTYPVARKAGFAFFTDLERWREWSPFEVAGVESARFTHEGDELDVVYRPFRIPVHGTIVLDEIVPAEMLVAALSFPGAPAVHERLVFHNAGTHAFMLEVELVMEPGHWFERSWMTMLPFLAGRDLRRSLERAHALMADDVLHRRDKAA